MYRRIYKTNKQQPIYNMYTRSKFFVCKTDYPLFHLYRKKTCIQTILLLENNCQGQKCEMDCMYLTADLTGAVIISIVNHLLCIFVPAERFYQAQSPDKSGPKSSWTATHYTEFQLTKSKKKFSNLYVLFSSWSWISSCSVTHLYVFRFLFSALNQVFMRGQIM